MKVGPDPVGQVRAALNALAAEHLATKWSSDALFHFEVLEVHPLVVVKMGVRNHEVFAAYAYIQQTWPTKGMAWGEVASSLYDQDPGWADVDLHVLRRGPSQFARLLVATRFGGCAGSSGVKYVAYQWDPEDPAAMADEIIDVEGGHGHGPAKWASDEEEPVSDGG